MIAPQNIHSRLTKLKTLAIDGFSRTAIEGAKYAANNEANPLRANFFATALRILFEHMMDALAPKDRVLQATWLGPERGHNGGPTRAQRVVFALQGGLSDRFVREELHVDVRPLQRRLIAAVDDLSRMIHGRENTILVDLSAQDTYIDTVLEALETFFALYHDCRSEILRPIEEEVTEAAIESMLSETINEVDELSTHHAIEEIYVASVNVKEIGPHHLVYDATGTLSVVLQWGSNSDRRRGEGGEVDQSFPFSCTIEVPVEDPWDLNEAEVNFSVDTSKWTDAMMPDEDDLWPGRP